MSVVREGVFADHVTSDCYCAPAILLGLTVDAMGTCRVACDDADNISCGGVSTPIVYSASIGGIFPELAARLAVPLPLYECDAKSKFDICYHFKIVELGDHPRSDQMRPHPGLGVEPPFPFLKCTTVFHFAPFPLTIRSDVDQDNYHDHDYAHHYDEHYDQYIYNTHHNHRQLYHKHHYHDNYHVHVYN